MTLSDTLQGPTSNYNDSKGNYLCYATVDAAVHDELHPRTQAHVSSTLGASAVQSSTEGACLVMGCI